MAGRTRRSAEEVIEANIAKAQENVDKAKEALDKAQAKLQALLDKKDEAKKAELLDALTKSGKTYDEIFAFLRDDE